MESSSKLFSVVLSSALVVSAILNAEAAPAYSEERVDSAKPPQQQYITQGDKLIGMDGQTYLLMRPESLPVENFEDSSDPFLEGYIQALIDVHYYEFKVLVTVKNHKVYLSNMPKNQLNANSIIAFVKDIPGVKSVEVTQTLSEQEMKAREKYVEIPRVNGVWFPQTTVLFQPLVADPRQVAYSAAYRGGDKVVGRTAAAVSIGDEFPAFRWLDVGPAHGDVQIGIDGCVFAVFSFSNIPPERDGESCELVNADYYVGIPVTYAFDKWSFRGRVYHISSHLGDEFIVNHPEYLYLRVNPSFEALDFISSYQYSRNIRFYGGPGVVLHSDHSFRLKPMYLKYGMEFRFLGHKLYYHRLYGSPFIAWHFENWQQQKWDFNIFLMMGYEISKLQGVGRHARIFVLGHHGFSYEGQFFNERTQYLEAGVSWGF